MYFNGTSKLIILSAETNVAFAADIYSRWKEWLELNDNSKYLQALRTLGGDPLPGNISVGAYYFLLNGWKILPNSRDHELLISGNIFTEDGSPLTAIVGGGYSVTIRLQTSSLALQSGSSGGSDPETIANSIWNKPLSSFNTPGTFGHKIRRNLIK